MNELISINYNSENPTVLGRELHEALNVETRYNDWFKRMCEYGFEENKDFYSNLSKTSDNGRPSTEHHLSISMAKEICMLQRSDKGKEFRQYFLKIEEAWNTPEMVMKRALSFANTTIEQFKKSNSTLLQKIEQDKPKIIFADAVSSAKTSILVGELAKLLKQNGVDTGEKRFFKWLRDNGYLIKRNGTDWNMPTQRSMDMKLFTVKETAVAHSDGHTSISKTVKVTGKGQQYFINLLLTEGEENEIL